MGWPLRTPLAALLLVASVTGAGATSYTFTALNIPGLASGINDAGQVVTGQGFVYDLTTGISTVISDPVASFTAVNGISNSGLIVGNAYRPGVFNPDIFTLNPVTGVFTNIPSQSSAPFGPTAIGINNAGAITGYYSISHQEYSFLINPTTSTLTTLIDPNNRPGLFQFNNQTAHGINDAGQIVGSNGAYGFLLDSKTGTFTDFAYPAAYNTNPVSINNSGQIAGYYTYPLNSTSPPFSAQAGFVLDEATGSYSTLIDPAGTDTFVTGVNDAGLVVGYYSDSNRNYFNFLATPVPAAFVPEPPSIAMLGAGVLGLAYIRRRSSTRS